MIVHPQASASALGKGRAHPHQECEACESTAGKPNRQRLYVFVSDRRLTHSHSNVLSLQAFKDGASFQRAAGKALRQFFVGAKTLDIRRVTSRLWDQNLHTFKLRAWSARLHNMFVELERFKLTAQFGYWAWAFESASSSSGVWA